MELGTNLEGEVIAFVEREQARKLPGDLFLAGPGVSHWAKITVYPLRFVTIYFLPSLLIELGPEHDGAQLVRRFTTQQSLRDRLVRPPPEMRREVLDRFKEIVQEFEHPQYGTEIRLRSILAEMLVRLLHRIRQQSPQAISGRPGQRGRAWNGDGHRSAPST